MFKLKASCHCENILIDINLSRSPESYNPRTCDCDFCRKHGASYLSDSAGSLVFHIKNKNQVGKYQQGSDQADFLICQNCGVLVGVTYKNFAAINSEAVDGTIFGDKISVSPKKLSAEEKSKRWQEVWFSNVTI